MLKPLLGAACVLTLLLAGSALAQVQLPPGTQIRPGPSLPPGTPTPTIPLAIACNVDPAIVSVTLTKGSRARQVRIRYEIRNLGRSAWASGANQQGAHLVAHNGNTGRDFTNHRPLPGATPAGARMTLFTSPFINEAFDDFEFGGHLDLAITYDPDIVIDGNACNDDANAANNHLRIENAAILGFMRGAARSQTFRP